MRAQESVTKWQMIREHGEGKRDLCSFWKLTVIRVERDSRECLVNEGLTMRS